ncbi:MAG: filamentous hemagglutinin N-terminal domain-containing protein [Coleofasciculaceae cyanobacterium]
MATRPSSCWCTGLVSSLAFSGAIALSFNCSSNLAQAQIVPDGTLGSAATPNAQTPGQPVGLIQIAGGAAQGSNLFHSFQDFNVGELQQVYFLNPVGIENILTRVTGNNPSNILGTLGVNGGADLFLLNPNGILFGSNARLDLDGAFVGTTNEALIWPDGSQFSAANPGDASSLLTIVGDPSGFLSSLRRPGSIEVSGSELTVEPGQNLFLLGGNVSLNNATLRSPGGLIELGGLAISGKAEIDPDDGSFSFPDSAVRANVTLTNGAVVDVTGSDGGDIAIIARNINISGTSNICAGIGPTPTCGGTVGAAVGSPASEAGNIFLSATREVNISQGSRVENDLNPNATGNSENIFEAIRNDTLFGSILIEADSVSLTEQAEVSTSTFGQGSAGLVFMQVEDDVVVDSSRIFSSVEPGAMGDAGGILIETGSLSVAGPLSLSNAARINSSTSGMGNAGAVIVQAEGAVSFINGDIFNNIEAGGKGVGGEVLIEAQSLSLLNGAQLQTLVRKADNDRLAGSGNAGNVTINVSGDVLIARSNDLEQPSAIFSGVGEGVTGNAGTIEIQSGSFTLTDDALLSTTNSDSGRAGDISISARDEVSILNQSSLFSEGDSGRIFIGQSEEFEDSFSPRIVRIDDSVLTTESAFGESGLISIDATESIFITNVGFNDDDEPRFSSSTLGDEVNAGNILLRSDGLVSIANSIIASQVKPEVMNGNAGTIGIVANSVSITDGSELSTITLGDGNAGIISIQARDDVSITGNRTLISTNVEAGAMGDALGISIEARSLTMADGAQLQSLTRGNGDAGIILVNTTDFINLSGSNPQGNSTAIFSTVEEEAEGNSLGISIETGSLIMTDGAQLQALTRGSGDAGFILVNAADSINLSGSSSQGFSTGLFATVEETATGNTSITRFGADSNVEAGAIIVVTKDLRIEDRATISVNNQGTGEAGNMIILARDVILKDQGTIQATTASGDGGGIFLFLDDFLLLLTGSRISTEAGTDDAPGTGGDIFTIVKYTIAAPFNDNNISAEAFTGPGGNIDIIANKLYDIEERDDNPSSNDITASSQFNIDGIVREDVLNVDPTQGLTNLPTEAIDPSQLIAETCVPRLGGEEKQTNQFVVTGRGGLPPDPNAAFPGEALVTDWGNSEPEVTNEPQSANPTRLTNPTPIALNSSQQPVLLEAQGWAYGPNGEIIFTAQAPNVTPNASPLMPASTCHDS